MAQPMAVAVAVALPMAYPQQARGYPQQTGYPTPQQAGYPTPQQAACVQ